MRTLEGVQEVVVRLAEGLRVMDGVCQVMPTIELMDNGVVVRMFVQFKEEAEE